MARIRTIKPEFWEDEKIGKLPIPCRLFFIGCWNFADDFGVIKNNPVLLKSQIFPYDENLRVSEIKKWIDALVDARMLIPIILDGEKNHPAEESYYLIRTFRSHQVLDKRYEKSFISKDKSFVKSLINTALSKTLCGHIVDTTSLHSEHQVNTSEEKEKEDKERTSIEVPKKPEARFIPPTVDEVSDYAFSKGYSIDAELFVNFYESKGWYVGKNKMKNWRAAVATWQKNEQKHNGNQNRNSHTSSKQEANDYALGQYLADRSALEQGLHDTSEKPF